MLRQRPGSELEHDPEAVAAVRLENGARAVAQGSVVIGTGSWTCKSTVVLAEHQGEQAQGSPIPGASLVPGHRQGKRADRLRGHHDLAILHGHPPDTPAGPVIRTLRAVWSSLARVGSTSTSTVYVWVAYIGPSTSKLASSCLEPQGGSAWALAGGAGATKSAGNAPATPPLTATRNGSHGGSDRCIGRSGTRRRSGSLPHPPLSPCCHRLSTQRPHAIGSAAADGSAKPFDSVRASSLDPKAGRCGDRLCPGRAEADLERGGLAAGLAQSLLALAGELEHELRPAGAPYTRTPLASAVARRAEVRVAVSRPVSVPAVGAVNSIARRRLRTSPRVPMRRRPRAKFFARPSSERRTAARSSCGQPPVQTCSQLTVQRISSHVLGLPGLPHPGRGPGLIAAGLRSGWLAPGMTSLGSGRGAAQVARVAEPDAVVLLPGEPLSVARPGGVDELAARVLIPAT